MNDKNIIASNDKIRSKKDLHEWLDYELANYNKTRKSINIALFRERDILAAFISALRRTEYHLNTNHKIRATLWHLRLNMISYKYGMHIYPNVCKKGLHIVHVGSILINGYCTVGNNCCFHINTSIVAGGTDKGYANIGDGVILGVGSTIVGGVTLANNIAVGANAVVTKSFLEENIAIAGVPAKKVSNNGHLNWSKSPTED